MEYKALKVAALAVLLGSGWSISSHSAEYVIKLAHNGPEQHPYQDGALAFERHLEASTNGAIDVQIFPGELAKGLKILADGGDIDRVGIAEGDGDTPTGDEGDQHTDEQRHDPTKAGLADFLQVDPVGGGDDREITQHAAAHQAKPREQRDIREPLAAAGGRAAHIGQHQAEDDGVENRHAVLLPMELFSPSARRDPVACDSASSSASHGMSSRTLRPAVSME